MKKNILIIYICFLIVTLVPAVAVTTSSLVSQETDNIKQSQQSLLDNKNKISETGNAIKYHANIIQDTIDGMNNVKWYQFWRWNYYINEGPNRIQSESKIIDVLSKKLDNNAKNTGQLANDTGENGNQTLQLALESSKLKTISTLQNDDYNVGDAASNANFIANELSSQFNTKYTVTKVGNLNNGDIVQYSLSNNNYVYLQYVGMNPAKDTLLFLGGKETALRLPISSYKNLNYKILPESDNTSQTIINSTLPQIDYIAATKS